MSQGVVYVPIAYAEVREAVALLRRVEWGRDGQCVVCGQVQMPHSDACPLGAFLCRMGTLPEDEWTGERWRRL